MKEEDSGDAEKYFRLIAENLTDMVSVVDGEGRRLYCTPNYSILGKAARQPGSDSFADIHPEDRERVKDIFRETMRTGLGRSAKYRLLLESGEVRHMQSQGIAVKSPSGEVEKVIIVARDVTDSVEFGEKQKALEQQLRQAEKLNSLGKTISGVAHELNNPLTGIMGFCQLLLRDEGIQENSRHREDINAVFREAERCQKIVRNLTTFARKHKPEKTHIGLNGLLADCLKLQENQLRVHNVEVRAEYDAQLPKTMADFHQLQQVFMNLIGNAQDAMAGLAGGKIISVKTRMADGFIRVEIADSGPGIPAEIADRIFEPFFTTKEPGKGTGLGLSISYGIIAGHGGSISAGNAPGGGALFTVDLPVMSPAPGPAQAAAAPAASPLHGQRVLIIDDEECVVDVTVRILRLLGLSPDMARDPATARRKLESCDYDAVLCDYRLPGENGLSLFNWAARLKPGLRERWIFLTGSSGGGELADTGRPVVNKPFSLEALELALVTLLAK